MKKLYISLICFIGYLMMGCTPSLAENSMELPSQGNIGFYGSYEYPENSDDLTVFGSEQEKDSNISINLEEKVSHKIFPKTGERLSKYLIFMGISALLVLLIIAIWNRKEEKK